MPSTVWDSFIKGDSETAGAQCKICGTVVSNKGGSTSSMRRHLSGIHRILPGGGENSTASNQGKSDRKPLVVVRNYVGCSESKSKTITTMLTKMIACEGLPMLCVEKPGFREFMAYLEPGYDIPNRSTITPAIMDLYQEEKQKLADILECTSDVALSVDCWTSCSAERYMTVTVHFVSQDHKLVSRVLDTRPVSDLPWGDCSNPQPLEGTQLHTADAIADRLSTIAEEWKITSKVTAVVHDNTADKGNISRKANFRNSCDVPCAAHTIQSSMNKGMGIARITSLVGAANRLVAHFNSSSTAAEVLESKQAGSKPEENKLVTACPARWNSVLTMFERLLKKRGEICAVLSDENYTKEQDAQTLGLMDESWELMEELVKCLKPFQFAVTVLSSDLYVSLSIVQPCVRALLNHLAESPDDSPTFRLFKARVTLDLAGQFPTSDARGTPSPACIAAALDPRFKKLDRFISAGPEGDRIIDEVRRQLQPFLVQQREEEESRETAAKKAKRAPSGLDFLLASTVDGADGEESDVKQMDEYERFRAVQRSTEDITTNTDPLEWWKVNSARFPLVAQLAHRYLCIPATSVPSARVFSAEGNVVNAKRSVLKPDSLDMLVFLSKITENE